MTESYNLDNESRKLGFVCGLKSEAECLQGVVPADMIFVSGASPARARAGAERLLNNGALGLISFGLSGALDPELRPGDLILSEAVAQTGKPLADMNRHWLGFLSSLAAEHGLAARPGIVYGSDDIVLSPQMKASLFERFSAHAVDMESHAVATAAEMANVPCIAIRAVADPYNRSIPKSALLAISEDGTIRAGRVMTRLVGRPQDLITLIRLGRDNQAALKSLRRFAHNLLPVFLGGI